MKRNDKIIAVAQGAMIAAIYAAATYASSALGIAYGQVQFRFSEALTALAVLTPAAGRLYPRQYRQPDGRVGYHLRLACDPACFSLCKGAAACQI